MQNRWLLASVETRRKNRIRRAALAPRRDAKEGLRFGKSAPFPFSVQRSGGARDTRRRISLPPRLSLM
jgi:hypothetical protein